MRALFCCSGLLVRQAGVYYPVRQALLSYIYQGITKFGFSQTASTEHKRLALDLIETVIKWDRRFLAEQQVAQVRCVTHYCRPSSRSSHC